MRMSAKMREIRAQIDRKVKEAQEFLEKKDLENARKAREEINDLKLQYEIAEEAFELEQGAPAGEPKGEPKDTGETVYNSALLYKVVTGEALNQQEKEIVSRERAAYQNKLEEGTSANGGITVPDDLSRQIIQSIEDNESVRNLVTVENVTSMTGTRIVRTGTPNKLYNTAERGQIQEMNNQQYDSITYKQHKFAGKMDISNELLNDSFVNFVNEITLWLSDASRITENEEILYGTGGDNSCEGLLSTADKFKTYAVPSAGLDIDFLRKISHAIKKGYRTRAAWLMNTEAFDEISKLKDGNGRSYLQPDPREADTYRLLGYRVIIMDSIKTETNKTKIAFGDFKRAYRMFARKNFGIRFTDIGSSAFDTDTTVARGIERFDGKIMDTEAVVIISDVAITALTEADTGDDEEEGGGGSGVSYTEAELKSMTKEQLLSIATDVGIKSVDNTNLKDEIVTAIVNGE